MKLTVQEASALLNTPETTIYRWIRDENMPCHRVNDHYRFHRAELLEWATVRGIPVSARLFQTSRRAHESSRPSFAAALYTGGVHHDVEGESRDSVLRGVVGRMPISDAADRELLLDVMLAREALGSTGIGDGIAIPHARSPIVVLGGGPSITLCFLRRSVEFGASDGRGVHTLFSIVTHTVRSHLFLLSRLSAGLEDPDFRRAVAERAPAAEILAVAARVESAHGADEEPNERC